jgi:hypothetical protein
MGSARFRGRCKLQIIWLFRHKGKPATEFRTLREEDEDADLDEHAMPLLEQQITVAYGDLIEEFRNNIRDRPSQTMFLACMREWCHSFMETTLAMQHLGWRQSRYSLTLTLLHYIYIGNFYSIAYKRQMCERPASHCGFPFIIGYITDLATVRKAVKLRTFDIVVSGAGVDPRDGEAYGDDFGLAELRAAIRRWVDAGLVAPWESRGCGLRLAHRDQQPLLRDMAFAAHINRYIKGPRLHKALAVVLEMGARGQYIWWCLVGDAYSS